MHRFFVVEYWCERGTGVSLLVSWEPADESSPAAKGHYFRQ